MNWSELLLWGFVATLVMTTAMQAAMFLGLSRMSVPMLLGTIFTADREKAAVLGFTVHLTNGWAFAVLYAVVFESLGKATWWWGALFGALHAAVILAAMMPILPGLHPRMASERQGPEPTRALEPPGFLALNYGRRTPLVTLVAHLAYGIILGAGYQVS